MAKQWADIAKSPDFASLADDDKDTVRQAFFDKVVAPELAPDQIDTTRSRFYGASGYGKHALPADMKPSDAGPGRGSGDARYQPPLADTTAPAPAAPAAPASVGLAGPRGRFGGTWSGVDATPDSGSVLDRVTQQPTRNPAGDGALSDDFIAAFRSKLAEAPPEKRLAALQAYAASPGIYGRAAQSILADVNRQNATPINPDDEALAGKLINAPHVVPAPQPQPLAPAQSVLARDTARFPDITPTYGDVMDRTTPEDIAKRRDLAAGLGDERAKQALEDPQKGLDDIESARRQRWAEAHPIASAFGSGGAQAMSLLNAPAAASEWLNTIAVNPVLTNLGFKALARTANVPGTEYFARAAADYMPAAAGGGGDKGMKEAWDNDKFIPWLTINMAAQAPQMGQQLLAAMAPELRAVMLPAMGAQQAGSSYQQGDSGTAAVTKGGIEWATEHLPLHVFDKLKDALKALPEPLRGAAITETFKRLIAGGGAITASALAEGGEEVASQFGQNIVDKYVQKQDTPLTKDLASSGLLGAAMGVSMSGPHLVHIAKGHETAGPAREIAAAIDAANLRNPTPWQVADIAGFHVEPVLADEPPDMQRKQRDKVFEGLASQYGVNPNAVKEAKKTAAGMPLYDVGPFYKRFIGALDARGGVAGHVDPHALNTLDAAPAVAPPPVDPATAPLSAKELNRIEVLGRKARGAPATTIKDLDGNTIQVAAQEPQPLTHDEAREFLGLMERMRGAESGTEVTTGAPKETTGAQEETKPPESETNQAAEVTTPAPAPATPQDAAVDRIAELFGKKPAEVTPSDIAAHDSATSPTNDRPEPTDAQKDAGNYKMGHLKLGVLNQSVENAQGSERKSKTDAPEQWTSEMVGGHYGYLVGIKGRDGQPLKGMDKERMDVLSKPDTPENYDGVAFVVDQVKEDGTPDEHKVLVGYDNEAEAKAAYLSNYPKGWKGLGHISTTTMDGLHTWLTTGDTSKPFYQPAAAPAEAPAARVMGYAGPTPKSKSAIELRPNEDGTLTPWHEGHELLDFDSGDPVRVPAAATNAQAADAIRAAGSFGKSMKLYGVEEDAPAANASSPQGVTSPMSAPPGKSSAATPASTEEERTKVPAPAPASSTAPSVADIHAMADQKGIKWSRDRKFMALSKLITGKPHLDDLNAAERHAVFERLSREPDKAPEPAPINGEKATRDEVVAQLEAGGKVMRFGEVTWIEYSDARDTWVVKKQSDGATTTVGPAGGRPGQEKQAAIERAIVSWDFGAGEPAIADVAKRTGVPLDWLETRKHALTEGWSDAKIRAQHAWELADRNVKAAYKYKPTGYDKQEEIKSQLVTEFGGEAAVAKRPTAFAMELAKRFNAEADRVNAAAETPGTLENARAERDDAKKADERMGHMHKANLEEISLAAEELKRMERQGRLTDEDQQAILDIERTSKDSYETAWRLHKLLQSKKAAGNDTLPVGNRGEAANEAAPAAQKPADDDLGAMFDELLAEETAAAAPPAPAPAPRKPATPQVPNEPGTKYVLPSFVTQQQRKKSQPGERTATQAAASAALNSAKALGNAIDGLGELFGGPGKLGSGPAFDEKTYAKAKPYFQAAIANLQDAGSDIREAMRAVIKLVLDKFGADTAARMRPYVIRFVEEMRNNAQQQQQEQQQQEPTNEPGRRDPRAVDNGQEPGNQPGVADGGHGGAGSDRHLAPTPAEDGRAPGAAEDPSGNGPRPVEPEGGRGARLPEGGDGANGRPGAGGTGVAAERAGDRGLARSGPARSNYHVADPEQLIGGTPKVRFARNRAAIEALNALQAEGRAPTPTELDAMASYIGWGSFGQELFNGSWDRPAPKAAWEKEDAWLREHLGKEAWQAAQNSIINAHYTDPITVGTMWDMVRALGFTGGRVLEPSLGIGNFYGMMPRDLMAQSQLTGIELDPTTGAMAQYLYPEANIQIKGYQDSKTADGFYDLVIGNWPFAKDGPPGDRRYAKLNPSLHDYFFLKALDQTRPGGIVIGVTSAGTMDKKGRATRMELAKKGELLGAFRLPSGAFEKYAGTSVVTDILVFRKREAPLADVTKEPFINLGEHMTPAGSTIHVNEYLLAHPENVLGTLNFGSGSTYGRPSMIVDRPANLQERMGELAARMPSDGYQQRENSVDTQHFITNNTSDRQGAITLDDKGGLFVVNGEHLIPLEQAVKYKLKDAAKTKAREQQLKELVGIRRAYGALIDAERAAADNVETLRTALREKYQAFVAAHGPIADSQGLAILDRAKDPFHSTLDALEHNGKPARVFTESTVRGKKRSATPSVREAFVAARNESLQIDPEKIAAAARKSVADTVAELEKSDAIFKTPVGNYEVSDVYLSGNVRRKLREVQDALAAGDKSMQRNIDALQKVLPKTVPYFQIEAKFGAPWVSHDEYQQFISELLAVNGKPEAKDIQVSFVSGSWKIRFEDDRLNTRPEATAQWGLPRSAIRFDKLLTAAINNRSVTIKEKDADGNLVVNEKLTKQANEKVTRVREEFSEWAWRDADRRVSLEKNYNEVMNAVATPAFDGSFLEFPGMALQRGNDPFSLRSHQVNAIWRGLANGSGLYAHEVGTGKTYTMAGIAIESRRYGLAKKPLLFAHNANSATVAREINDMYPGAQVLYIDNLNPGEIDTTMRRIANDDWDVVVVPHSLSDRFALTRETLEAQSAEEIAALEQEAMDVAQEEGAGALTEAMMDDPEAMKKVRSATAKQLVHARNQIKKKISDMVIRSSREGAISFEELGVDMILVDEAHEFKKPPLVTKMKMRGLNTGTSNRSIALRFLTDYVKNQNGGRGVHAFTGTPITNTLAEIYNQMRYVMDAQMARDGIKDWDTWFATFADSSTDVELTPAGEYEAITRLAAFVNVAELRRMAGQYMDIVFADDMPEFKPRPTSTGKIASDPTLTDAERNELLTSRSDNPIGRPYKKIVTDTAGMGPAQLAKQHELAELSRLFKNASKKDRRDMMLSGHPASPVLVETAAANAGLDIRLIDPGAADEENSKVNRVVRNVKGHYDEHPLATQVIFMDRGYSDQGTTTKTLPNGAKITQKVQRFNLAKDIVAKLVAQGIPQEQIAIVDGGVSKEARKAIADKMNRAEIRVVIGLTSTLGVGVNMQSNLRAMHHLDAPWMPGELEQRNGRGWRQGNHWNTVLEYRYITEKLDGRRWQVLAVKQRFIKAFLTADENTRVIDGDAVEMDEGEGGGSDIADTLSEASGDPRIMLREKLKAGVEKLETRERMHTHGVSDAKQKVRDLVFRQEQNADELKKLEADQAAYAAGKDAPFTATLGDKTVTKRADFDEALLASLQAAKMARGDDKIRLGTVYGFKLMGAWPHFSDGVLLTLVGKRTYAVSPSIQSIDGVLRNTLKTIADLEKQTQDAKESAARLADVAKLPFQQADVLKKKRKTLAELEADLKANPTPPPSWLRYGAPVGTLIYVDGDPLPVEGHRHGEDDYYIVTPEGDVPYQDARDENGLRIFEPVQFAKPVRSLAGITVTDSTGRPVEIISGPMDGQVQIKMFDDDGREVRKSVSESSLNLPTRVPNLRPRKAAPVAEAPVRFPAQSERLPPAAGLSLESRGLGSRVTPLGRVLDNFASLGDRLGTPQQGMRDAASKMNVPNTRDLLRGDDLRGNAFARVNLTTGAVEWSPTARLTRAEWAQTMAEELMHSVDHVGINTAISATSERLLPGGDIAREAQAVFDSNRGLADLLSYPMWPGYKLGPERVAAELFARLAVIYHGDQALMRRELPTAYEAFHVLFGSTLLGADERLLQDVRRAGPAGGERGGDGGRNASGAGASSGRSGAQNRTADQGLDTLRARIAEIFHADPAGGLIPDDGLAASGTPTRSAWLDPTNRLQFAPGNFLYEKLGDLASPLWDRLNFKLMSPELKKLVRQMKLEVQQAQDTAVAVVRETNQFDKGEREMISDIIEKELASGTTPPAHAVRLAALMSQVMSDQSRELVALGMLSQEAAQRWDGQYLPRFYKPKLSKQASDAWYIAMNRVRRSAQPLRGVKGDHLRGRGKYEVIGTDRLPEYQALGWQVRDDGFDPDTSEQVKVWRDFTRAERDAMGEMRDAGFRFVMGYMQTQKDLALGRMFAALAADPTMSVREGTQPEGWVKVPETLVRNTSIRRFGQLAGRYVSRETFSHLQQYEEMSGTMAKAWRWFVSGWKMGMTALNPVSHVNNVVGNLTMAHFAGVSYHRGDKYLGALKDFVMKGPGLQEARDAGLFVGTHSDAELVRELPKELRALVAQQRGVLKIGADLAFNIATLGLKRPLTALYGAEDTFFKYMLYKDARGRGMAPGDAVNHAERYIFTYDDLPSGARAVSNTFVPFFSWTYKAVPALLHTALAHPARFAGPIAVTWLANAIGYALAAGGDDDDWYEKLKKAISDPAYRAKMQALHDEEQKGLPPWMRHKSALFETYSNGIPKAATPTTSLFDRDSVIRLGKDSVTHFPMFIDVGRMIPGGDLFDVAPHAGGISFPAPITPSNPLFTIGSGMFGNKDLWTGKPIVDANDTGWEKTEKYADWIWRNTAPAIAIGGRHWQTAMNAAAHAAGGTANWMPTFMSDKYTGIQKSGLPAQPSLAAANIMGIKINPQDLQRSEQIDQAMKQKAIRDILAEMRALKRQESIGAVRPAEVQREMVKAREKIQNVQRGLTVSGDER